MRNSTPRTSPVRMPLVGRRTRNAAKTALVLSLILIIAVSSIGAWLPGLVSAFGSTFPSTPAQIQETCSTTGSNNAITLTNSTNQCSQSTGSPGSNTPNYVGADPLPSLSPRQTVLSSVDNLVGTGVIQQTSSENLTIYDYEVGLRLLGGVFPHDELLGPGYRTLSSKFFWEVQAIAAGTPVPLVPYSNTFRVIGTNSTGAYVSRTMLVSGGTYSGVLSVLYMTTAAGPMKLDLEFTANTAAQYSITFAWWNVTSNSDLLSGTKQFRVAYLPLNYTFSWGDIPSSFNATSQSLPGRFGLSISLGTMSVGSSISLDPTIASNVGSYATAYSIQRHIFRDSKTSYYWAFYSDGMNIRYKYSLDGIQWSFPSDTNGMMPTGWPSYYSPRCCSPSVSTSGETVLVVSGQEVSQAKAPPWSASISVYYVYGTLSGATIRWQTVQTSITFTDTCQWSPFGQSCVMDLRFQYVNAGLSSNGNPALSYNLYDSKTTPCAPNPNTMYNSTLIAQYNSQLLNIATSANCGGGVPDYPSAIVPADASGGMRLVYEVQQASLSAVWFNGLTKGSTETILQNWQLCDFCYSAVTDANYNTHVIFESWSGPPFSETFTLNYAYRPVSGPWTTTASIFPGNATDGTATVDYSTNTVYLFAMQGSSVLMKSKVPGHAWSDGTTVYPVTFRNSPNFLGSNFAISSGTNSSNIMLDWTEGPSNGPFNVTFASIPIGPSWSPYSFPKDPWDANGIVPYGEYFANLGEYVSPSTGMLTISQTDLSVPGRGLSIDITRLYIEPQAFLNNAPYNYEKYPWAPIGDGWQLNYPWFNNTSQPLYIHLSSGEGYRIPQSFWSGFTATFENHQGENFRLVRYVDGTIALLDESGTSYSFGTSPNHALTSIRDSTGNNTITFTYSNGLISCITDSIGRAFTFSYSGGFLQNVAQVTGTCASPGTTVRRVTYGNNGQSLTSMTDPAGRITYYSYNATGTSSIAAWLLSRIRYPTLWLTNYTYAPVLLGTTAYAYRVKLQLTGSSLTTPTRQFAYSYAHPVGDQVTNSTVTTYNGTSVVSYTKYAYSSSLLVKNVTDPSGRLVSGDRQFFGVNGQIPKEVVVVSDGNGNIGSYTNYYSYDLWGNQIYSRRVINPSSNSYHESFSAYYNNAEQPGFKAFQDSFSRNQGASSDNSWNVSSGYWIVNNGLYNGTETGGKQESMFSWFNVGKTDISIQARIYTSKQINASDARIGLIAHYPGSGLNKRALVLHNGSGGVKLSLLDEYVSWVVENPCTLLYNTWYTFNFTTHGNAATGWASAPGISTCSVSGAFPSDSVATATGFGLYAGGYSALFDDVQVATVSPYITATGFSNSFIQNSAPGPIGLNTWMATTKPPGLGWNTTANWLAASSWSQAYPSQNYGATPWGTLTGWTDNSAQWIWASANANVSASIGPVWFRRTFSVPTTSTLNVAIATDDTYVVYLDGSKLGSGSNWHQVGSYTSTVSPGYHVLAINATNTGGPAGLLESVKNTGTGQTLFRSDATSGPSILAVAGSAQLQNGPSSPSEETYYGYTTWGGMSQAKRLYTPTGGSQWLTTSRTYDSYGNLKTLTDARGNSTSYGYSPAYQSAYLTTANQTLVPGGTLISQRYSYNLTMGTLRSSVDGRGYNTTIQYDILGRTTRITYPTSDYTAYAYNDAANYVDITNENGLHTRQIYDGLGRQVKIDRFLGGTSYSNSSTTYNWMNLVTRQTDPLGNSYVYQYDALGRLTSTTQPDGNITSTSYNDLASLVLSTDQYGNRACRVYDRMGRMVSVIEYSDSNCNPLTLNGYTYVTNYSYDEIGDLLQTTTANAKSTMYIYDNLNRLLQTTYADGNIESYSYDSDGNIVRKVNRNNVKTLFSYDSLNRILTISYCGSPITSQSYTYDLNSNMLSLQNQNSTDSYIYDSRNRVLNETYAVNQSTRQVVDLGCFGSGGTSTTSGGVSKTYMVGTTYNGELINTIAYPTISQSNPDITIKYAYDTLGRVLNVTYVSTGAYYARLAYSKTDKVLGIQYGNGLVGNYTYDKLLRASTITLQNTGTHTTMMSLTYGYNKTGTVSSVVGQVNSVTVNEQYKYDPLQRLTNSTVTSSGGRTTLWYQYNNVGNRLSQNINGTVTTYTYNAANNELLSSSKPGQSIAYAYDKNGNMLNKNVTAGGTVRWYYTWDVAGNLLKTTNSTGQGLYAYDGYGRRVESIEAGSTWYYAYSGTEILYKNLLNTDNYEYVFASGIRLVMVIDRSSTYYYHADALGSVRMITYSDATMVYTDGYQPYGQDNGTPTGSFKNRATDKFTGKPVSQTTGLYYEYHRWYDPGIGRFISPDSKPGQLSNPQSLNRYVYVQDRPTSLTDRTGECPECIIGLVAGLAVGYAACVAGGGGWLSSQCAEEALVGGAVGALAGATFGLSLLVTGGGLTGALSAGAISGFIAGFANFDLESALGLKPATVQQLATDVVGGVLSGIAGGLIAGLAGGTADFTFQPGRLIDELENSGTSAIEQVANSRPYRFLAGVLGSGDSGAISISKVGAITVGAGVKITEAVAGGVVEPIVHWGADQLHAGASAASNGLNTVVQWGSAGVGDVENFVSSGLGWL